MKLKLPGYFSKPIPKKKFEKTVLKYAFVKEYQDYLSSRFVLEGEFYVPNFEIAKEDVKKLKDIQKTVKKENKGFISTGKIAVVGITLGAIVVFFVFFANSILEQTAENALAKTFGAKVEITGLRLDLLGMKASFSHMSVGDKEQEFKNLFEAGPFVLSFNPLAATSRKVYLEKLSVGGLAFDTDRKTSGWTSVPEEKSITNEEKPDPLAQTLSALNLDVKSIFEEEKAKLGSPALAENAAKTWGEKGLQYQKDVEKGKTDYTTLLKTVDSVKKIDLSKVTIKDIPALKKQFDDGIKAVDTVSKMSAEYSKKLQVIGEDLSAAYKDSTGLLVSAEKDVDYLLGFFDFSSEQTKGVFSSLFSRQIYRYVGDLYSKVLYVKGMSDKITAPNEDKKSKLKKEKVSRNLGEKVAFPSSTFPDFGLEFLGASSADKSWDVSFRNISSDPDLMPGATEAKAALNFAGTALNLEASLDLRKNQAGMLVAKIDFDRYNLDLGKALEAAGITGAKGYLQGKAEFELAKDNSFGGKISLVWDTPEFSIKQDDSILSKVLTEVFAELHIVDFSIAVNIPANGIADIKIESGLDEILAAKLEKYVAGLIKDAEKQIRAYLDEAIAPYKKKLEEGKAKLSSAQSEIQSMLTGLEQNKKDLENKKKEIEAKIKQLESDALGGIKLPF